MQRGNIAVQTENIFPIIKKFLYSDHDIFLRELVSNAVDATNKLKTLVSKGDAQAELGDLTIDIRVDEAAKTITISDKGVGMTAEEVNKYLNQVAFSSAQEFLDKYKDDANIIGHFGLGFYSAFMVADKVEVHTKSWREDAPAVTWTCEGDPEYTLEDNDNKTARGTDIVLHVNEDSKEFLEKSRIQQLLNKYCKFLPIAIRFGTKTETVYEGEGEEETSKEVEVDNIVNNTAPIWRKQPAELKDEDYRSFYNELYPFSTPPMFWIHLNIDYPFNLTGVLYFPKISTNFEVQKNKIQLYSNQVYVTDEVKDIVPEFLTLLHGVIDSPDIPLNVSRSYLQADQHVKKITGHITKKVADKLYDLFKEDRKAYEDKWPDLSVFVKYGMLSDDKFNDRAQKFALLQGTAGELHTFEEYKEKVAPLQTDKHGKVVFIYANNKDEQHSQIEACRQRGYDVLLFDHIIDSHFLQHIEYKIGGVTFVRVDSDIADNLVQKDEKKESVLSEEEEQQVKAVFEGFVQGGMGSSVMTQALSPDDQPVIITRPEFMRRMKEMQAMQGMSFGDFPDSYNVIVNTNHPLVADRLLKEADTAKQADLAEYLYKLALLNQNMLKGADLTAFVNKSLALL